MKKKKGQALVETALMVPVLLLLLGGIVDFGRILHAQSKFNLLAQESVRLAGLGKSDSDVESFAYSRVDEQTKATMYVDVLPDIVAPDINRRSGSYVSVEIRYEIKYITPFMNSVLRGPFKAKTQSTIRVE